MFKRARLKLTFFYSVIFLLLFWTLSFGIYFWMNHFFGDSKFRQFHINQHVLRNGENSSDMIMDELRNAIIAVDGSLFFIVPIVIWFLTEITLDPLQKAHSREKRFLSDVSHDLRTPLSIISADLEVSLRTEQANDVYKRILESNKEEVDDLIALVENMLLLSRIDSIGYNELISPVDLTDILVERVSVFKKLSHQKQIKMSYILPTSAFCVLSNQQLLKRLFTIILDNAVKYTLPKGEIKVKSRIDGKYCIITFSDTGIGISESDKSKVFDRFYRSDSSRAEKGYGLGLSIAKQILELTRGKITLKSRVGVGKSIIISLPRQNQGKNLS